MTPTSNHLGAAAGGLDHPYVGMWVTDDGRIRHQLLADGRYDEARGAKESAYRGRHTVTGDHIDYVDDTGFTADGDFVDGVLHHAGMILRRRASTPAGLSRASIQTHHKDIIMTKTWFITGATRGLGKEIALAALGAGENVVATGRKAEDVVKALAEANAGERLLAVALDVTDDARPLQVVEDAIERFGRIDVLVNNAGYGQLGFFETLAPGQIEAQFRTNVFGLYNVTRAVLPQMRAQHSGHVLNISSIGGVVGFGGAAAYTSSKFAIEGFSEDMAIDLKPFGIHVTIVEPGFFRTDFLEQTSVKYGEVAVDDYAEADSAQRAQYGAHSRKQLGDPAKLGQALLRIVAADEPPLRYAAGSDAVRMTRETLEKRLAELDRWRDLSESTDSDDAKLADAA